MATVDVVQRPELPTQTGPVEDVVPEHQGRCVTGEELLTEQEGLGQALGSFLDDVGERDPELGAVPQQPDERRLVLGGRDDEDLPQPGVHEGGDGVVHHRLVVDRQQLLADPPGDGPQARSSSPGKHDSLHGRQVKHAGARG